jgi:tetratricopeptide (TPR) repeat protein
MSEPRPRLPGSYEGLRDQARDAYRSGDTQAAITQFRHLVGKLGGLSPQLLARRPELGEIRLESGQDLVALLRQEGRYAEAIEVAEGLAVLHPDADRLQTDLAVLRIAKGEVARGLADLQTLSDQDPDDVWLSIILGNEARFEGHFAESQAALDRALVAAGTADDPEVMAEVHYQRFQLFKDMAQLDQAMAEWEKAYASHSDVAGTVHQVYTMLTDAGRYGQAQQYVARDENRLRAGLQRGLIANLTGNRDKARKEWREVAALDPHEFDAGHEAWVEAVLRLGDPKPVLDAQQLLLTRSGSPRILALSGTAWAMHGDRELAQRFYQQSIDRLRHDRPPKQKLDSADWRLLDSLVADDELKTALKPYFAVVETLWQ